MAKIAVIGASTSDYTNIRVVSALTSFGHEVQNISQNSMPNLNSFDLIMTARFMGSTGFPQIKAAFENGVSVIVGMEQAPANGIGPTAQHLGGLIGLNKSTNFDSTTNRVIISTDLFQNYINGDVVNIHPGDENYSYCQVADVCEDAMIIGMHGAQPTVRVLLIAAQKGKTSLNGNQFPASCGFFGPGYTSNYDYVQSGKELLNNFVHYVLSLNSNAVISGFITDDSGQPLNRTVRLYDQVSGSLVSSTVSDATGYYSFDVLSEQLYFVVCESDSSDKNFQVNAHVVGVS